MDHLYDVDEVGLIRSASSGFRGFSLQTVQTHIKNQVTYVFARPRFYARGLAAVVEGILKEITAQLQIQAIEILDYAEVARL